MRQRRAYHTPRIILLPGVGIGVGISIGIDMNLGLGLGLGMGMGTGTERVTGNDMKFKVKRA